MTRTYYSCICLCKDTNFKANHNYTGLSNNVQLRCICLCKDTNFKANHNSTLAFIPLLRVVYAYAKTLILKQITTESRRDVAQFSCICLCKDTNFKANHNLYRRISYCIIVVYAYAKILILKQITTIETVQERR